MSINGIVFPLEISAVEANCIVCLEKLKWPIFCPRCRHGNCYDCLLLWFQQKKECPKCRFVFQLQEEARGRYGCPGDGNLVESYCEQCAECLCRMCLGNRHLHHQLKSLDALRKEMFDAVKLLSGKAIFGKKSAEQVLIKIKSLVPNGTPIEWVRQRGAIRAEIGNLNPMFPENGQKATRKYDLPNTDFYERSFYIADYYAPQKSFSAADPQGNTWELTVYPNGFSDATGKFISLYLKLVHGTPMRYEYLFKIFDKLNRPLETYFAVDDFNVGSQSIACQRLIHINQARQHAWGVQGYRIAFATRSTDPMYGPRCEQALTTNSIKRLNYVTFMYTVKKFSEHKAANRILFSNVMHDQQGIAWRFRIDCNGHWEQGEYVSVFLELLNGAQGWFDIFLRVNNPVDPTNFFKRELTHKFTVHSNWGVPHFIHQSQVYQYLRNDQLEFQFGMRPAHIAKEM